MVLSMATDDFFDLLDVAGIDYALDGDVTFSREKTKKASTKRDTSPQEATKKQPEIEQIALDPAVFGGAP